MRELESWMGDLEVGDLGSDEAWGGVRGLESEKPGELGSKMVGE